MSCRCIAECCCGLTTCMAWLLPAACLPVQACTEEKHAFVSKIFKASGISYTNAALPACLQPTMTPEPKTDLHSAQQEAKMVLGQVVGDVLNKTGGGQCCLMVPAGKGSQLSTNVPVPLERKQRCSWPNTLSLYERCCRQHAAPHLQAAQQYVPPACILTLQACALRTLTSSSPTAPSTAPHPQSHQCSSTCSR